VVVPPGIDLEPLLALTGRSGRLRELVGAGPEVFLLGVVGRLAPVKAPERALEVLGMLAAAHPRLELAFVGDGSERRSLERRILALPPALRGRVHLCGAIEDMAAALADLDALLLCSHSEGLPVALIEAAAAGLPVVATPVGGVPELVVHERTGLLGADVDELAFGVAALLERPDLGRALGVRARLRVASRHSAAALADRLLAVYEAVLGERRCAS
jgi:glycosyltransferase involved in cell wall biosynthesis